MIANSVENLTQINQFRTIQLESNNRSPANWGEPNDVSAERIPCKMVTPLLAKGMEEWNFTICNRVKSRDFIVLGTVTTLTDKGQIVEFCLSATAER